MVSWIDGSLAAFIPAVTEEGKKILSGQTAAPQQAG
jgi:hypothetical protein